MILINFVFYYKNKYNKYLIFNILKKIKYININNTFSVYSHCFKYSATDLKAVVLPSELLLVLN